MPRKEKELPLAMLYWRSYSRMIRSTTSEIARREREHVTFNLPTLRAKLANLKRERDSYVAEFRRA